MPVPFWPAIALAGINRHAPTAPAEMSRLMRSTPPSGLAHLIRVWSGPTVGFDRALDSPAMGARPSDGGDESRGLRHDPWPSPRREPRPPLAAAARSPRGPE